MKVASIVLTALFVLVACGGGIEEAPTGQAQTPGDQTDKEIVDKGEDKDRERIGVVRLSIDGAEMTLDTFRTGYTDMTVIDEQITCRLKDATQDRSILLGLNGAGTAKQPVGTFKPPKESSSGETSALVTLIGFFAEGDIMDQFTLKSGSFTVTALNPGDGTFQASFEGKGGALRDIRNENLVPFSGSMDLKFRTIQDMRQAK